MPKQLHLSCIIDLSDNVFEAAKTTSALANPWAEMLNQLEAANIKHVHTCETLETRAKVERKPRGPNKGKVPTEPDLEMAK